MSVFREIRKILPEENYIYYSDSANCPYGGRSEDFIIDRCREITDFLLSEGADIIVVACNTATAAAIKTLRAEYPVKFIGMEPAIKPAAQMTRTGVVGVLATAGTLNSAKYLRHKEKYASDIQIAEHVGKGFVELVEKGITTGPEAISTVRGSLEPLINAGADTIVLGCTHYPFLTEAIQEAGAEIAKDKTLQIIDPAPAIAKRLLEVMNEEGIELNHDKGSVVLHTSGNKDILQRFYDSLV